MTSIIDPNTGVMSEKGIREPAIFSGRYPTADGLGYTYVAIVDFAKGHFPTATATDGFLEGLTPTTVLTEGSLITSASFRVLTPFDSAGNSATLTLGFYSMDGTSDGLVYDADGIDAAIAETSIDALNDLIACDGAIVGTVLTEEVFVTMSIGTELFTAGKGILTINCIGPAILAI